MRMKDREIRPSHSKSSLEHKISVMRADRREAEYNSKLSKVMDSKTLKENIDKVLDFDAECEQNGQKCSSRYSILITLHMLCQFAENRLFKDFKKADIMEFFRKAKCREFEDTRYRKRHGSVESILAESSMNLIRYRVKRFFQWLYCCDRGEYPECVKWIKLRTVKGEKEILAEDLPTVKEVKKMIASADCPRDRALISLLAESGARVGEISMIRIRDIFWNKYGLKIRLSGKTGTRNIPLRACVDDIRNWINNYHPFKDDPDAPLFTSYATRKIKTNLKIEGIANVVRIVAVRSGVEKRVHMHPHLFRHFRASQLAMAGWNETMLRHYFGWSEKSRMPNSVYIHVKQKAIDNYYYEMYGCQIAESNKGPELNRPEKCSHCGMRNPNGYQTCANCGSLLDRKEQQIISQKDHITKTLNAITADPELAQDFMKLLQKAAIRQNYKFCFQ